MSLNVVFSVLFCFLNQIFQIYILWHPISPIDRTRGVAVVVPGLQTDDLNPQTTPDTRPPKSATAGKEARSAKLALLLLHLITTVSKSCLKEVLKFR